MNVSPRAVWALSPPRDGRAYVDGISDRQPLWLRWRAACLHSNSQGDADGQRDDLCCPYSPAALGTPCWLVDILSRVTRMQVGEIAEGCIFEPNHVYVIPAGEDLTMDGAAFSLVPATTVNGWPDAFDIYLDSVARTTQRRAVTVILSGMSEDGSAALKDLRRSGGLNYAQADAPSRGMPESAVRTGMVDYVGSPEAIAALILGLPEIGLVASSLEGLQPF